MVALPDKAKSTQERIAGAAARLGEDASKIDHYHMNLYKMREAGVLVDITVHGFTMFTKRAGWLELGIPAKDVRAAQFTRGSKYLIPRCYIRKLDSLDTRFRTTLDKYGADITGFKPYRYLTYEACADWLADFEKLETELEELKAEIIDNYEQFKADAVKTHTESAREAWDALISRQGGDPERAAFQLENGHIIENRAAFIAYVTKRVLDQFPNVEKVRRRIRVERRYQIGLSRADLAEDEYLAEYWQARTAQQRAQTAYYDEQAEADRRLAREQEEAKKRIIQEREWTQRRMIRAEAEERELEVKERQARLDVIKSEIEREIREQIQDTILPIQEVILSERHRLHQGLDEVLETIESLGYLHGKTAQKMENLIERFRYFQHFDEALIPEVNSLEEALASRIPHPDKKGAMTYNVDKVMSQTRALILHTQETAQILAHDRSATRAGAVMF